MAQFHKSAALKQDDTPKSNIILQNRDEPQLKIQFIDGTEQSPFTMDHSNNVGILRRHQSNQVFSKMKPSTTKGNDRQAIQMPSGFRKSVMNLAATEIEATEQENASEEMVDLLE